jgi:hypothetical protein
VGVLRNRVVAGSLVGLILALAAAWLLFDRRGEERDMAKVQQVPDSIGEQWESMVRRGLAELRAKPDRGYPFSALQEEEMPPEMRDAVLSTLPHSQSLRLRFDRARYGRTQLGGGLWVVPGRGVTCMVRDRTAISLCDTTAQVRERGLALEVSSRENGRVGSLMFGIAPDRVRVRKAEVRGEERKIPVVGNTFALRAENSIRLLPPDRP